ncbi:MAG: hypothetical protein RLY93_16190 [Sumerlaeia bacterium]
MKRVIVLVVLLASAGAFAVVHAISPRASSIEVENATVSSGGGVSSSSTYSLDDSITVGDTVGDTSSASYSINSETYETPESGLDWRSVEDNQ